MSESGSVFRETVVVEEDVASCTTTCSDTSSATLSTTSYSAAPCTGWVCASALCSTGRFCCAGGTTRGLIDAHGYVIAGLDKQESCRKTYVTNNGNETGDRGYPDFLAFDLFPTTEDHPTGQQSKAFSQLDGLIGEHCARFPEVPLLFAICAPCQPFTGLGKAELSEGRVAERLRDRELLAHACRFVDRYVPDMVLSENVLGITDPRYAGVWEDFANRLRDMNYNVTTLRVCTSVFGIPQYRKRSILAGIRTAPERVSIRSNCLRRIVRRRSGRSRRFSKACHRWRRVGNMRKFPIMSPET